MNSTTLPQHSLDFIYFDQATHLKIKVNYKIIRHVNTTTFSITIYRRSYNPLL